MWSVHLIKLPIYVSSTTNNTWSRRNSSTQHWLNVLNYHHHHFRQLRQWPPHINDTSTTTIHPPRRIQDTTTTTTTPQNSTKRARTMTVSTVVRALGMLFLNVGFFFLYFTNVSIQVIRLHLHHYCATQPLQRRRQEMGLETCRVTWMGPNDATRRLGQVHFSFYFIYSFY